MYEDQKYMVSAYEPEGVEGPVVFTFVPKGSLQDRGPGPVQRHVPQFIVAVRSAPDQLNFDWSGTADDPGTAKAEIQDEITTRMHERANWIERVSQLVKMVDQWATELGWSTRQIGKKL